MKSLKIYQLRPTVHCTTFETLNAHKEMSRIIMVHGIQLWHEVFAVHTILCRYLGQLNRIGPGDQFVQPVDSKGRVEVVKENRCIQNKCLMEVAKDNERESGR